MANVSEMRKMMGDDRPNPVGLTGCRIIRCTCWYGGCCHYQGDICKYQEQDPEKIADRIKELERELDEYKDVMNGVRLLPDAKLSQGPALVAFTLAQLRAENKRLSDEVATCNAWILFGKPSPPVDELTQLRTERDGLLKCIEDFEANYVHHDEVEMYKSAPIDYEAIKKKFHRPENTTQAQKGGD